MRSISCNVAAAIAAATVALAGCGAQNTTHAVHFGFKSQGSGPHRHSRGDTP